MNFSILYRGPLSSCNYSCDYCPFAKTKNTRAELEDDKKKLRRFVNWTKENAQHHFGILFTPWGEALIRKYYQEAITELSHSENIRKVAIQTNLSCPTGWMKHCNPDKLALWTTFHPTQISRADFVKKCRQLFESGVRFSVGTVGFTDALPEIEKLREELPPEIYVWVNANKKTADYYSEENINRLLAVDPLFSWNLHAHQSLGESCRAGESVFSVDGDGNMTRCHFIKTRIGNIYDPSWEKALRRQACTNATCGCHIGYVHLDKLNLQPVYGDGLLERIPVDMGK
ncbi:MAG: radical SAM domain-containing protein [Bacteroidetes bacterium]|nr:MAG: radical SAM domain-containing protein [Bacteroidota bacterium]